jgi:hypothetical protein
MIIINIITIIIIIIIIMIIIIIIIVIIIITIIIIIIISTFMYTESLQTNEMIRSLTVEEQRSLNCEVKLHAMMNQP